MKNIGFIGAYDKTDFILHVAKVLTELKYKVLVVDATIMEKARYIVPVINPTISYITEFEKIDVAVGFKNMEEIKRFMAVSEERELDYDYVLLDVDRTETFESFEVLYCDKRFFVTSFDLCSLKKGLKILENLNVDTRMTKVIFSKGVQNQDDEYINHLSENYHVEWEQNRIFLPIDNGDLSIIIENQRTNKTGLKKLSQQYKENLTYVLEDVLGEDGSLAKIKKAFKNIEKEG